MYNNSLSEFGGTANNYYTLKLVWNQKTLWKVNVKQTFKIPWVKKPAETILYLKMRRSPSLWKTAPYAKEVRTDFKKNKNNLVLVGSII